MQTWPKIIHDLSIPHAHQTNAKRERLNQDDIAGCRALLLQAGLSHAWWSYAITCFCHSFCCFALDEQGKTPFELRHGFVPKHLPLPFGCLITVKPSETAEKKKGKFEPAGYQAIYLGPIRVQVAFLMGLHG